MDYVPPRPWKADLARDSDGHVSPQSVLPGQWEQMTQATSKAIAWGTLP